LTDIKNVQTQRRREKIVSKPQAITVCCLMEYTGNLSKEESTQNASEMAVSPFCSVFSGFIIIRFPLEIGI